MPHCLFPTQSKKKASRPAKAPAGCYMVVRVRAPWILVTIFVPGGPILHLFLFPSLRCCCRWSGSKPKKERKQQKERRLLAPKPTLWPGSCFWSTLSYPKSDSVLRSFCQISVFSFFQVSQRQTKGTSCRGPAEKRTSWFPLSGTSNKCFSPPPP